ncbi:uncharacterized protein [Typha latifolia]|uniref:uncharacterized protein n=1 Tax=Typha latifolia TaxID=4733 RepID=UPI003C300A9E
MATSINSLWEIGAAMNLRSISRVSAGHSQSSIGVRHTIHRTSFCKPLSSPFCGSRKNTKIPLAIDSNKADAESTSDSSTVKNAGDDNQLQSANIELGVNGNSPQVTELAPKRSPLTAREKVRAARVLSKYAESKPSKSVFGSKVLDALRESDKGKKRSGLPEAPTNLLDDSKRGMPKAGWTFDLPVGSDILLIVLSVVLISTIMFGTTYIVWKLGAIHFNEY